MDAVGPDRDQLLLRLMSAATQRAKVLSENIANPSVPGYVRRDVRFEELVAARLARGGEGVESVRPQVVEDRATPAGPDGNNVHLESEVNAMRENLLAYQLYAQMLDSRHSLVQIAIQEGR